MWILGPMAFEWLIAPQSPITCRFAIKNAFKRGTALSCSVLRFWVISEKPHFLAKNGTFWLIALVTLFAPQSPISHNFYMQNAFKWGITLLCSALRFPISSLSKGHVHCGLRLKSIVIARQRHGPKTCKLELFWIWRLWL